MVKIKICGLRQDADIKMVNRYLPDYVGFVFAESRRKVSEEQAAELRKNLDERIIPTGVFVNAQQEKIVRLVRKGIIDAVQLHGDEGEAYIRSLKAEIPEVPIIKAVRVRNGSQILKTEKLDCDYLLLDTFTKDVYGGSGKQFDKTLIPELRKPYFLAGGLSAVNVIDNLKLCSPYAVDISSAVETDGMKDEGKIKDFIERVRNYE